MMRRTIVLAFALLLTVLVVASPALAQGRDPFDPAPGDGVETPSDTGTSERDPFDPEEGEGTQPTVQETPDPTDTPTSDPSVEPTVAPVPDPNDGDVQGTLSNTGADVTTWGGIGYVLVAVGLAALAFGRTFAHTAPRRRR